MASREAGACEDDGNFQRVVDKRSRPPLLSAPFSTRIFFHGQYRIRPQARPSDRHPNHPQPGGQVPTEDRPQSGLECHFRRRRQGRAETQIRSAISLASRAAKSNVIHKNAVSRLQSRLAKAANAKAKA